MIKQGTYNELVLLRDDIQRNAAASPSFAFFFSEKIKNFFQKNAVDLNCVKKKTWQLLKEYCELDENGEPLKIVEEGKEDAWRFKSEEAAAQFDGAFSEFMNRAIKIHC